MTNFLKNEDGDTNIVPIIIILVIVVVAVLIFRPYIAQFIDWVKGLF